jgi:hypothetical protein
MYSTFQRRHFERVNMMAAFFLSSALFMLMQQGAQAADSNPFYTGFHYQPLQNWMNVRH